MTQQHTPGPWRTSMDEPYELEVVSDSRSICKVWLDDAPVRDYNDEQQANARLIAASPALLKAAKRALNVLKAQGETIRPGTVLQALDEAIRAAA